MAPIVRDVVPLRVPKVLIFEEEVQGPAIEGRLHTAIQPLHGPQLPSDLTRSGGYVVHDHGRPRAGAHVDARNVGGRIAGQVVQGHSPSVGLDATKLGIRLDRDSIGQHRRGCLDARRFG
jgi:hypothetical protein